MQIILRLLVATDSQLPDAGHWLGCSWILKAACHLPVPPDTGQQSDGCVNQANAIPERRSGEPTWGQSCSCLLSWHTSSPPAISLFATVSIAASSCGRRTSYLTYFLCVLGQTDIIPSNIPLIKIGVCIFRCGFCNSRMSWEIGGGCVVRDTTLAHDHLSLAHTCMVWSSASSRVSAPTAVECMTSVILFP